jgi:fatty acid desaturase
MSPEQPANDPARLEARKRVHARRRFAGDVVVFVVVSAALIGIWAATSRAYFWPGWVIGAWAVLLGLHGWRVFVQAPVTEADVDAELRRHQN